MARRLAWTCIAAIAAATALGCRSQRSIYVTHDPDAAPGTMEEAAAQNGAPEAQTIEVSARDHSFTPAQIQALPGQRLRIVLRNEGAHPHSLEVDHPLGHVGLKSPVAIGGTGSVELEAPVEPGEYDFFCPLHRELGMEGRLIVRAPGR